VNQAIDAGVRWLADKDNKEKKHIYVKGNFSDEITAPRLYDPNGKGNPYVYPTGCTSLALYALLKSGVPKDDPVIVKGFDWLKGGSSSMTKGRTGKSTSNRIPGCSYEISALILALEARANPHKMEAERERELKFKLKKGEKLKTGVKLAPDDEAWMKDLVTSLVRRQAPKKGWRYGLDSGAGKISQGFGGDSDLSSSNLAMLALLAADRCGISQGDELYATVLNWTLSVQEKEGPEVSRWEPGVKEDDRRYSAQKDHARGFGYLGTTGADDENRASGSMTCCGIANILICTAILEGRESKSLTPELQSQAERGWWDGVAWLDYNWTVDRNFNNPQGYHYYYLYCLERGCDLKRISLLAGHPWYNLGAQVLVDNQDPDGAWSKQDTHQPCDILNTCFALLFLNRSTPAITAGD
jgi:hypothetical protein